tara:strand:+ start:190 stop:516 length:327 start_codon:yes stop_codon:yes gene_type:complete
MILKKLFYKAISCMKFCLSFLFLFFLTNCGQYTAMVGPSYTLIETGSVLQATNSYGSSYLFKKVKQGYSNELADQRICQEIHSSELQSIFFKTQDNKDCFHDPMSIYR